MQLTLHATRRTPHGASRLVQAMSAWSVKTRHAPCRHCGVVGMRGSMVMRPRPCMNIEYAPPPPVAGGLYVTKIARVALSRNICMFNGKLTMDNTESFRPPLPPPLVRYPRVCGHTTTAMHRLSTPPYMEEFGALESSEKEVVILGDRWLRGTAKQERGGISRQFLHIAWKKRNERPNVEGVSTRSRNSAPPRKGCVVNAQTTKARKQMSTSPHPSPSPFRCRCPGSWILQG